MSPTPPVYWIDSGVLIQAERGAYSQQMLPQFWLFIDEQLAAGRIRMPLRTWKDIIDGGYTDLLQSWCKNRKQNGLAVGTTKEAQASYGVVGAHICAVYKEWPQQINDFLRCSDGWLIAFVHANPGSILVTQENSKARGKIKVPRVCDALDIRHCDTIQMLKDLKADFSKGVR